MKQFIYLSVMLLCLFPAAGFSATQPAVAVPSPPGLIAWLSGNGNTNDPVSGTTGTVYPPAVITDAGTGFANQAFSFFEYGYVTIPDGVSLRPTQFSISLWFNWDHVGTDNIEFLMAKGFEKYEIHLGGIGTNGIRFIPAGHPSTTVDAPDVVTAGWHHLVVTYSGSEAYIYLDGLLKAQRTDITERTDLTTDHTPLHLGIRSSGEYPYYGKIDEPMLFNRVLSPDEINAIHDAGSASITLLPPVVGKSSTTATLNGVVNDNGEKSTVSFEYGRDTTYGSTMDATPSTVAAGSGVTSVSVTLTGLIANSSYHFRIKALNASGTTYGPDQLFGTHPTTTELVSGTNPSSSGQPVTFTASVISDAPTGFVIFYDGTTPLRTVSLSPEGGATYTTPLAAGSYTVTAVYSGDKTHIASLSAILTQTVKSVSPPTLIVPAIENVGAGMATLVLQSSGDGTGYFTLLYGGGTACGTGAQVKAGENSDGGVAPYHGSLPLLANTAGRYAVRSLTQNTDYTLCFTADSPTGFNLNPTPVSATFTTAATATFATPLWSLVGNTGFSSGEADYASLSIAPDGTPYVAYTDADNSGKATVMAFRNGTWGVVGNAGFSAGQLGSTSLTIAPDGTPYVAYQDFADSWQVTVMAFRDNSWSMVGSTGVAYFDSLAIAPDGAPCVAYEDQDNGGKATVMAFRNGLWSIVGSAGFSADQVSSLSLAIAPDGTPYVAYTDWSNSGMAMVMAFRNGIWSVVGNAGFSAGQASYTMLTIASDGTPYVAYTDWGNGGKATVMAFRDGMWSTVGNAGFSTDEADYPFLTIASDGTPYVAYTDVGNGGKAMVMAFRNGVWSVVGSTGFSTNQAYYPFLSIAPDGTPYVAYTDWGNGGKATVMKLTEAAVNVTVTTLPAGRSFTVDGFTHTTPETFSWVPGSSHTIATTSFQEGSSGTRYNFAAWSDGGAGSHSITVPATPVTCTAIFTTQYQMTTTAGPNGTITPDTGWYAAGSPVTVQALPATGYHLATVMLDGTGQAITDSKNYGVIFPNLTAPHTLSATFAGDLLPVKIGGTPYSTLRVAYDVAVTGDLLQSQTVLFSGGLLLDRGIAVTIRGGYDAGFVNRTGYTTVQNGLTIVNGRLTVDRLIIR